MSFGEAVLKRALSRMEERKATHQAGQEALRREAYETIPELLSLDRSLQTSIPQVLSAAFRYGEDPAVAVARLREQNLGLQKRREELLREAGFSPRDLEDKPICPLCNDSGWRGVHHVPLSEIPLCPGADSRAVPFAELGGAVLLPLPAGLLRGRVVAGLWSIPSCQYGKGFGLLPTLCGALWENAHQKPVLSRGNRIGENLSFRMHCQGGLGRRLFRGV